MIRRPPRSTLFPNTPLSRSVKLVKRLEAAVEVPPRRQPPILRRPRLRRRRPLVADGEVVEPHESFGVMPIGLRRLEQPARDEDRKSTRLNSSHANISYAVFC